MSTTRKAIFTEVLEFLSPYPLSLLELYALIIDKHPLRRETFKNLLEDMIAGKKIKLVGNKYQLVKK